MKESPSWDSDMMEKSMIGGGVQPKKAQGDIDFMSEEKVKTS